MQKLQTQFLEIFPRKSTKNPALAGLVGHTDSRDDWIVNLAEILQQKHYFVNISAWTCRELSPVDLG